MEPPLDNVEEVVTGHVLDGLATGHGHVPTFDLEEGLAIDCCDVEAVARQGQDLLLQDKSLGGLGDVLLEDAHWAGIGLEASHFERVDVPVLLVDCRLRLMNSIVSYSRLRLLMNQDSV